MVSDRAFACPQCARPVVALGKEWTGTSERSGGGVPRSHAIPTAEASTTGGVEVAAQPVVSEWLGGIRKARELPAGSKTCRRCGADVALDTFRKKSGDGYICSDCVDEDEERREGRRVLFSKMLIGISLLLVGLTLTIVAVQFAPVLLERRTTRNK
jgi:hypothetical protein